MTVFVADAATLAPVVASAAKFAASTKITPNPIVQGVLIEAADGLTLTGTDLLSTGAYAAGAAVVEPGRCLVPARLLADVVSAFGAREGVRFAAAGGELTVSSGRDVSHLPTLPVEDWPELPGGGDPIGEVDGTALRDALARVLPAIDRHCVLPWRSCVQVTADARELTLAGTDGYRLALGSLPWSPVANLEPDRLNFRTPGEFLVTAARGAEGCPLRLSVDDRTLTLATDRMRLSGRLSAEPWPDLRRAVPEAADRAVRVAIDELNAATDRVLAVLRQDRTERRALLSVTPDGLTLAASLDGDRSMTAHCPVLDYSGDDFETGINVEYLRACLATCKAGGAETVEIWLGSGSKNPLAFHPLDDAGKPVSDFQHIVVPVLLRFLRARR